MNFKKILMVISMILGLGLAAGCGGSAASPTPAKSTAQQQASLSGKKVLIAYFSWSGNTKAAAEKIQGLVFGTATKEQKAATRASWDHWDIIHPGEYDATTDRAKQEQKDNARPAIAGKADLSKYDVIMVGYPIWWYQEPMIIDTFLESGDFSGKTIVPFCTSGGSSIDKSIEHMKTVVKGASFAQGFRYDGNDKEMNQWLNSLGLLKK